MRQQIAGLVLAGVCTLAVGCTTTVGGKAVAADKSGPAAQNPVAVSALDGLLLDVGQINAALGQTAFAFEIGEQPVDGLDRCCVLDLG